MDSICSTCQSMSESSEHDCATVLLSRLKRLQNAAEFSTLSDERMFTRVKDIKEVYESLRGLTELRTKKIEKATEDRDRAYNIQQSARGFYKTARESLMKRLADD
jgi:uncharacterized membrane protein YccC